MSVVEPIVTELRHTVENKADLAAADDIAKRIIQSCDADDATAMALRGEGLFEALCIHTSLTAMEGLPMADIRRLTRRFNTCVLSETHSALGCYVEGTALLRESAHLARQKFSEALAHDNYFVIAYIGIGVAYFQEHQWKKAFSALREVIQSLGTLTPNIVRVLLGICAFQLEQVDHARKCLKRALEVDPDDPMALLASFAMHAHFREASNAARVVDRLQQVAPTLMVQMKQTDIVFYKAVARDSLAEVAPQLTERIQATRQRAVDGGLTNLVAYADMQLGRLLHAMGEYKRALELYDAALRADSTLRAAEVHQVEALHEVDTAAACLEAAEAGLAKNSKDARLAAMASSLCTRVGKHNRAIALSKLLYESVARDRSDSWTLAAWTNRLDSGEFTRLAALATQVRRSFKLATDSAMNANAAVVEKNPEALVAAARACDVDLENIMTTTVGPREYPFAYNYALLLEEGNAAKARAIYIKLVKDAPSEPHSYERLAVLADRAGRPAEALRWAKMLEAADPNSHDGVVFQAWVLKNRDLLPESLRLVREAAARRREDALAMCTGSLYLADAAHSSHSDRKLHMALNGFQYALRHDPQNVLAAHGAACCLASQGKHAHASLLLERVSEVDCNVPSLKQGVREHRFNVLVETRAYRNAISTFSGREALTKWQRCALAVCFTAIGEHTKAIASLDVAFAEHKKDASVSFYLMFTLLHAVFDTILSKKSVTHAMGTAAHDNLERLEHVGRYAIAVKSDSQKRAVRQILTFIKKGGIARAIDRRVQEHERDLRDLANDTDAWRQAATQHEVERAATQQALQVQVDEREELRRQQSQQTFLHLQRLQERLFAQATGTAVAAEADPNVTAALDAGAAIDAGYADAYGDVADPEAAAAAMAASMGYGDAAAAGAEDDADDELLGVAPGAAKRPRDEAEGGLAGEFAGLARNVEVDAPPEALAVMHEALAEDAAADAAADATLRVTDSVAGAPAGPTDQ